MEDGYEFFAKMKLVTLFSAPNYCNEFDNDGAMLHVGDDLRCYFFKQKPAEKEMKNKLPDKIFPWMKGNKRPGTPLRR